MRRPGFLAGNIISRPRRLGLGNFGKGYAPPPRPTPQPTSSGPKMLPVTGGTSLTYAIDKSTKKFYIQDTRCKTGTRLATVPCTGDCDPGETEND